MKDFKYNKLILEIYLGCMGFFLIAIFIYFRIIMEKSHYSLAILKNDVTFFFLMLNCFFILYHGTIIIMFFYLKFWYNKKKMQVPLIINIKKLFDFFIWNPLTYLLDKISPHIPYSGTLFIYYSHFFIKTDFRIFLLQLLCFSLYMLPRLVMSLIFFYEIIFCNEIKYFSKYFFLFLFPIFYNIFLQLSEKFYINNIDDVYKGLVVTNAGEPNIYGVYTAHNFVIKENSEYAQEDLCNLIECWQVLFYIVNLNAIVREFINKYMYFCILFISCLYLIAFSYQLFFLIAK